MEDWADFSRFVKHEARFTAFTQFAKALGPANEAPMTDESKEARIARFLNGFEAGLEDLVIDIPTGTSLFRCRILPPGQRHSHERMTSPPLSKTTNQRMSPTGISYFYAADERDTAIAETRPYLGAQVSVAEFKAIDFIPILDLANLPQRTSIFDEERFHFYFERFYLPFLRDFSREISQPIVPGQEPIEYLPSQAFSEFIKNNQFERSIFGIRYLSAINEGRTAIVLFRDRSISLGPEPWLKFKYNSTTSRQVNAVQYSTKKPRAKSRRAARFRRK